MDKININRALIEALQKLPDSLSFEDFIRHPDIQRLHLGPLMWREAYELYEMPGILENISSYRS